MTPAHRHHRAADSHEAAAVRHEQALAFWTVRGDDERADLERRNVVIERDAARLERDRAVLEERRDDRFVPEAF